MAGQSLAAYHPEKALMQGTDSPCPCKASFPSPLLLFLLITAAIFQSNGHASAILVSGFLYVPALTVGTPSFIHPPCRSRKKTGTEQDLPCRGHLRQHAAAAVETTEIFPAHYGLFLAALI